MAIEKRLRRLLQMLPVTAVLGVDSDFSKYKYLFQLTDKIRHKEKFVNQYLKGKVDVVVYPLKYGENQYVKLNRGYEQVADIEKAVIEYHSTIQAVILPGKCLGEDCLFEIPGRWDSDYEFTFGNTLQQIVFVEMFPYGKENFVELIWKVIRQYPYYVTKKVLLYKGSVRYGATDITSLEGAIDKTILALSNLVQEIQVFDASQSDEKLGKVRYDLVSQYKKKKAKEIEDVKEFFISGFEYEYSRESTRYLNIGCDGKDGVLSEQSFQKASVFENVRNAVDVEKAILENYLTIFAGGRDSIVGLAKRLYGIYLDRFLDVESVDFEDMAKRTIGLIRKKYRCKGRKACPETPIEYLVLCNKEGYVVKLKKCVSKSVEENIHLEIKKGIVQKLKECEEKYL